MLFQVQEIGTDHGPLLAGALMIAAPLLIVFIVAQRQLLDNLAWGPAKPSKGATKP
jgi:multiple sugar transport system permease protein